MLVRRFLMMWAMVAVLFAPLVSLTPAMAAMPMHGQAMVTTPSHCGEADPGRDNGNNQMPDDCCTAICGAATIPPALAMTPLRHDRPVTMSFESGPRRSFIAALPTPPPRHG
jgi:hypothetical protein